MRGRTERQPNIFVQINLEQLVPADHPLRAIKRMADEVLAAMSRTFTAAYAPAAKGGRPSIPPERLLKALVLMSACTRCGPSGPCASGSPSTCSSAGSST